MINEQDLKQIFEAKRLDIPDGGFSQQVKKCLPERKSILSQIIVPLSAIAGFALVVVIFGAVPIFNQMLELIMAVSRLEMPSALSLFVYLSGLTMLGFIAFTVGEIKETV